MVAYWFTSSSDWMRERSARSLCGESSRGPLGTPGRVARAQIGLLNTMILTHLPSNVFLMLVPYMPTLPLAVAMLLLRFSTSQMDVPTRQSYTMAVVEPDERSAASG